MPKIIENLRDALLDEARRQIAERGYKATTIRSIASECGIAVGTVYNYFSSKDMIIASFMLEDWFSLIEGVKKESADNPRSYLYSIYSNLRAFSERHSALFYDKDAAKSYGAALGERHKLLCSQMAELILPLCVNIESRELASLFIAESLLSLTMAGHDFEPIYEIIIKIIK